MSHMSSRRPASSVCIVLPAPRPLSARPSLAVLPGMALHTPVWQVELMPARPECEKGAVWADYEPAVSARIETWWQELQRTRTGPPLEIWPEFPGWHAVATPTMWQCSPRGHLRLMRRVLVPMEPWERARS